MPSRTVSKRGLKEARATVEQARYIHKRAIVELDAQRQALHKERTEAVTALISLAHHYGINGFTPDHSLPDIVQQILDHLPTDGGTAGPGPKPASPTRIDTSGLGYRATCTCGWRSSWAGKEAMAASAAIAHEERMHT